MIHVDEEEPSQGERGRAGGENNEIGYSSAEDSEPNKSPVYLTCETRNRSHDKENSTLRFLFIFFRSALLSPSGSVEDRGNLSISQSALQLYNNQGNLQAC